jgi:FG-GAP repeat
MKYHAWLLSVTLSISSFAQVQKPPALKRVDATLLASDGQAGGRFGSGVAVNGNIVAVGTCQPGSPVYLFSRLSKGVVNQIATVSASDGAQLCSVAVADNGSLVVVGAVNETVGGNPDQGAVYVFEEPEGGWTGNVIETAKLTASDGGANNFLGTSVSATDGVIVAGSDRGGEQASGEAYVYVEPQGGWANGTETAQLKPSNRQPGDYFGNAVSIEGRTIAASSASTIGAVYVFQERQGGWKSTTETARLEHPGLDLPAVLGGNPSTIVVGAQETAPRGAVYVFVEPPGGWVTTSTPTATLTAPKSLISPHQCLGTFVAVGATMIAAGDVCETYGHNGDSIGDTYVYLKPEGGWHDYEGGIAIRPKGADKACLPAVGGNRVIMGAPSTNVGGNEAQGEAFIYTVPAQ